MIGARCEQIERVAKATRPQGRAASRERDLQFEVFAERRLQAQDQIDNQRDEPLETRAARLEQLLKSLECSLEYFCPASAGPAAAGGDRPWSVRVR